MAFVVETGEGLDTANSYLSVANYRAYHADRGLTLADSGAQASALVQGYLVQATDYLDALYGERVRGTKLEDDQSLAFPRECLYDNAGVLIEGVPVAVEKATAEAAYLASQRTLVPNPPAPVSSTGTPEAVTPIVRKLERVEGAVTEETEYAQPAAAALPAGQLQVYPKVDRLMRPLLYPVGAVRA